MTLPSPDAAASAQTKQRKKNQKKKKFRLGLYSHPFCDRTLIPCSVGNPIFWGGVFSLFFIFFLFPCFFFLFYIFYSCFDRLLRLLKIERGVAAQLTRLQALGPRRKISPPLSLKELGARAVQRHILLSVHDIVNSLLFPSYFHPTARSTSRVGASNQFSSLHSLAQGPPTFTKGARVLTQLLFAFISKFFCSLPSA